MIVGTYPLHPVTAYCLPRLSERVAQNERTLFTFLCSEDVAALPTVLAQMDSEGQPFPLVRVDRLYDYFASAMKADRASGGAHKVWSAAEAALLKFRDDQETTTAIKALAVLLVVGEHALPSSEVLSFALGGGADAALDRLKARKAVIFRRTEGYWQFVEGSDLDIESEIGERAATLPLTHLQLRQYVERAVPLRYQPARRYNDEYSMTRFFHAIYRTPTELAMVDQAWDGVLRQRAYADGLLVYVLASDRHDLELAYEVLARHKHPQVVFLLAPEPLALQEPLRELLALEAIAQDPASQDGDARVSKELEFFKEEARQRLDRALDPVVDPRRGATIWVEGKARDNCVTSPSILARELSEVLLRVFPLTPRISNEGLNRREPTGNQTRAAEKVIEAFLRDPLPANLGLTGHGPDVAIMRTVLAATGILLLDGPEPAFQDPDEESDAQPGPAWRALQEAIERAETESMSFESILDDLQSPPFGMRRGVLPVLLAACLRRFLDRATIARDGEIISPLVGATFTDICIQPDHYTLRLEPLDARRTAALHVVEQEIAGRYVQSEERRSQPLRYIGLGLLRWLQALPPYTRTTQFLSPETSRFRRLIQIAAAQLAQSLLIDLPNLLLPDTTDDLNFESHARAALLQRVSDLEQAYRGLVARVGEATVRVFEGHGGSTEARGAVLRWIRAVEEQTGLGLANHLFGDVIVESLVLVATTDTPPQEDFAEYLGWKLMGLPLQDWGQHTEVEFEERLAKARDRVIAELTEQHDDTGALVRVAVSLPDGTALQAQFAETPLSSAAQHLLTNLKRTIDITGRAMTIDERRRIGVEVLRYAIERRG